jgi:hypothetical protein
MSWIKNFIANLFITLLSVTFIFILLEVFLMWDDYYKDFPNPYITKINNIKYKVYFDNKKLNNNKKILVMGDSFIQGDFCAFNQKTLPDEMQKLKKNVNILNLGLGGKSLPNYLDLLKEVKPKPEDKVIIFLYDNDIFVSKEMCELAIVHRKNYNTYKPIFCQKLINDNNKDRSEDTLIKYINSKIRTLKTVSMIKDGLINVPYFQKFFFRFEYNKLWTDFNSEENKYITNLIIYLKKYIESQGAKFYLTYFPNTTYISLENPEAKMWVDYFKFLKTNHNINSINAYQFLILNAPQKSMTRSLSDDHPSCNVYKILAPFYINALKD